MFQLSRKIDYGLFLTVELTKKQIHGDETPLSLKKLAQQHMLSFFFLQKVAQDLRLAGLIEADRGKNGGYYLSKKATKISLKDILEALEGPINIMSCFAPNQKSQTCIRQTWCTARKGLNIVKEKFTETLKNIPLTHLTKI